MAEKKFAVLLKDVENLGLIPHLVQVSYTDGMIDVRYSLIYSGNKQNYESDMSVVERALLKYCIQLEPETIMKKLDDRNVQKWTVFSQKYFVHKTKDRKQLQMREYLKDLINQSLDKFYKQLDGQTIFLWNGDNPAMWKVLSVEEGKPDVFYHFDRHEEGIRYFLDVVYENKKLNLFHSVLLSTMPARILRKNSIFEFDEDVLGTNLLPFFSKETLEISNSAVDSYFELFVEPLLMRTKKVIANGFTIVDIETKPNVVLSVTSEMKSQQMSLFDEDNSSDVDLKLRFNLIFEYEKYPYQIGQNTKFVFRENEDGKVKFYRVERDFEYEKSVVKDLKLMGMNFSLTFQVLSFDEGIEWLNINYTSLEKMGIEIRRKEGVRNEKNYFIGTSNIQVSAEEGIDWFELKGNVKFGEYTFDLKDIIALIVKKRSEIRLPNGEFAKFPAAWIEEYSILGNYSVFQDKKVLTPKHHFVLLEEMREKGFVKFDLNKKLMALMQVNEISEYELPNGFVGTLRPYQKTGYNWLMFLNELSLGGCLADDMGLGKTIQTLCLLQKIKEQKKQTSLLVVPKSLLENWRREAALFCPQLKIYTHSGYKRTTDPSVFFEYDIVITSYAILREDILMFENVIFSYFILDEAQYIKNPQSGIHRACMMIKANHYLALTGTPLENSVVDLWSQMHFVNRNIFGSLSHFLNTFNTAERMELLSRIIRPFVLRRLKALVANDLPEKIISTNYCEMTPEQSEIYKSVKNEIRQSILKSGDEPEGNFKFNLLEGLLRMRQIANHPKLFDETFEDSSGKFSMVIEMLQMLLESGNKVLVFSSFVKHLQLFVSHLQKESIPFCYLDGQTKDRQAEVDRFQNDDDYKIFLLSLKAGGLGLNLTQAEYVFLLDPWWNPAAEAQAYDRAHRIGQKKNVFVYKFISKDTIEEKILELQSEKIKLFESLITTDDGFVKNLSKEDVKYLLS
ncbi:MAG: DEAD/DEAH box helicase [Bacteroidales bacterium]|nr:DEAD/DEAH box helicase [Bacteroidales bacterium]